MVVFGLPAEQLYMYALLASGALTVLCVFFCDIADLKSGLPVFNLTVILAFIIFGSAIGFLMETATELSELVILAISGGAATVLTVVLYFLILLPLSAAESLSTYSEEPLPGQMANVIISIPVDGYGEVVLENCAGMISKRATGYNNEAIRQDEKVLIVEVNDGTLYVQASKPKTL
ncbi:hypothetical protein [Planococcus soli]|uniref:hypothetical protein n=1 Tax=Planococcus soli TaxID=2666072 RepID=UPI00115CF2A6|nr:hypothetical protein [Planococcus soli]